MEATGPTGRPRTSEVEVEAGIRTGRSLPTK